MPKLRYLNFSRCRISCDVWFLASMVSTSRLESIAYDENIKTEVVAPIGEVSALLDLIKHLKKLKTLRARQEVMDAVTKFCIQENHLELQLTTLHLEFLNQFDKTDFYSTWKFVESQKESLRNLHFRSTCFRGEELQDLLLLNLKMLTFWYCNLSWNSSRKTKNSSIGTIKIFNEIEYVSDDSIDAIVHLLSSCETVTTLKIDFHEYGDRLMPVLFAIASKYFDLTPKLDERHNYSFCWIH